MWFPRVFSTPIQPDWSPLMSRKVSPWFYHVEDSSHRGTPSYHPFIYIYVCIDGMFHKPSSHWGIPMTLVLPPHHYSPLSTTINVIAHHCSIFQIVDLLITEVSSHIMTMLVSSHRGTPTSHLLISKSSIYLEGFPWNQPALGVPPWRAGTPHMLFPL